MRILWRLKKYGLRYRAAMTVAYVSTVAALAAELLIPPLMGTAIDDALGSGLRSRQLLIGAAIMALSLLHIVFVYAQAYSEEWAAQRGAYDLRNDILNKLLSMSFAYYDRQRTGDLMSRATSDVDRLQFYVTTGLIRVVSMTLHLVGVATFMLITNFGLALISLSFVAIYAWHSVENRGALGQLFDRLQAETGNMSAMLQENIAGMRLVKAFGAGRYQASKFKATASELAKLNYEADRYWTSRDSTYMLMNALMVGGVIWYGGREIIAGHLTTGELTAFLLYLALLGRPVQKGVMFALGLARAAASGRRVVEVLDAVSPVVERPDARPLARVRGAVTFEQVSMTYDPTKKADPAVRDVSFDVEPGQLVAILGTPGSGKTTIAHLIPRFYDVTAGRVTIDGLDVRDITLQSLRRNVGIALQDVFVFGAPFRENIIYGAEGAGDEDMIRAAKIAQLHDFIVGLPEGYDTWVGERGVKLSGGQRQRLAIARTILTDPPILILDDSTSSVDMETEHRMQQALSEVVAGRTTFVIAHRLSTVRDADLILVVDRGKIVERGTHDELMPLEGYYSRIYRLQLAPTVEQALDRGLDSETRVVADV